MTAQRCTWVFVLHYAHRHLPPAVWPHGTASEAWAAALMLKGANRSDVVSVVLAGVEYEVEA